MSFHGPAMTEKNNYYHRDRGISLPTESAGGAHREVNALAQLAGVNNNTIRHHDGSVGEW